jgi:hypothetical protein
LVDSREKTEKTPAINEFDRRSRRMPETCGHPEFPVLNGTVGPGDHRNLGTGENLLKIEKPRRLGSSDCIESESDEKSPRSTISRSA